MQTDPIGYEDGMNLYAYVGNDPINLSDPTGLIRVPLDISTFDEVMRGERLPTQDEATNLIAGFVGGVLGAGSDERITITPAATVSGTMAQGTGAILGVASGFAAPGPGGKARAVGSSLRFTQKTASRTFSDGGIFRGQSIATVADKIKRGSVAVADVPVQFIERAGTRLIVNTRSFLALRRAGVPKDQMRLINQTGNRAIEADVTERLARNNLGDTGTDVLRITGAGQTQSVIRP